MKKEEVEAKAKELKEIHGIDIMPILVTDENGKAHAAFIKHPTFNQLCFVFDKIAAGSATDGAAAIFDLGIIKEESSERFYSNKTEDIKMKFSGVVYCMEFVKIFENEMKKK